MTETQRQIVALLGHLCDNGREQTSRSSRWNTSKVAVVCGVSRKTVTNCMERYPARSLGLAVPTTVGVD